MQHDRFQMIPSTKYFSIAILCFCLQACSGNGLAPVTQRDQANESSTTSKKTNKNVKDKSVKRLKKNKSGCHVVVKGDTLYSIAWRYNYDYKKLADWNGIKSPYVIYLGDSICFKQIFKKKKEKLVKKESITKKKEINKSNIKKEGKNKDLSGKAINWFWPTKGKIVKLNSPTSKKGVDISGSPGQVIKAAARGEIVYSRSGLVAYGKLIPKEFLDIPKSGFLNIHASLFPKWRCAAPPHRGALGAVHPTHPNLCLYKSSLYLLII